MTDVQLMILDPNAPAAPTAETVFGGVPSVGDGFEWPTCATCDAAMTFQGQIRRSPDRTLLIFMCEADPGMCDDWSADDGGNAAIAVGAAGLRSPETPAGTDERARYGARVETVESEDYDTARTEWAEQHGGKPREILGQIGGEPSWLQADETPDCAACGKPMTHVAQLEQGPDSRTEMNFGGGCAYLFDCDCAGAAPKFLWQC